MSLPDHAAFDALRERGCLVTGGLGFIGSNLVRRLVAEGVRVHIVDALIPDHGGDRRNVAGLDVEILDTDVGHPAVAEVMSCVGTVFNLAGQVSHTASMVDPERDLFLNAVSHVRFLEMLRTTNPTARVVHTSTRQVYGRAIRFPVDEEHPARPVDVNGVAKLAGEQLHLVYAHAYDMAITSLRLTNVYGPRQRLTSDELGFLPVFVRKALTGATIDLFGGGAQRRDCLFVDDVVEALLAATAPSAIGKVYNVGHVESHALSDIAALVVKLGIEAGAPASTVEITEWPADHQRIDIGSFETDSSSIFADLGWAATTSLADGLRATLDFYQEHPWYLSST